MARTITNPINSSALSSSVIRNELQLLETEVADLTTGHDHDGTDSKLLDWDLCWTDAVHSHLSNAEGGTLTLAAIADITASLTNLNSINQTLGTSNSPTFAGLTLTGFSGYVKATAGVLSGQTGVPHTDLTYSGLTVGHFLRASGASAASFSAIQAGDLPTSIPLSQLASGTSAQIIVCNVTGVPAYVAMSQDATISNTGGLTIANDAISFAKMQNIATASLIGRATAGTGDPENLTNIPTGITIGSAYIYRAGGTDIAVADGGTGASDAATARTNLGVAIGSNVQAYDATLTSIALLGTAADKLAYTTGVDTWAEATLTAAGRALIDDADTAAQRTTLGLVIGTNVQAYHTNLTSLAGLSYASLSFVKMSAAGTFSLDTATYLTGNQTITLSGDVSGSGATAITTAIGADKITEAMLKAVDTAVDEDILTYESTTGDFEWHSSAELKTAMSLGSVENTALSTWVGTANITTLGTIGTGTWNATTIGISKGGTNLTSYVLGDILYSSAANVLSALAGNITTTKKYLSQTGTGAVSAAPAWSQIQIAEIDCSNQSRARAYRATSVQTIANATATKIELNAETYDTLNEFDSVTNYRFVATIAGYYNVKGQVQWASSVDQSLHYIYIYKNNASISADGKRSSGAGSFNQAVSDMIYLAINDYVELFVYQGTGGNVNITNDATETFLSIHKLS